MDYVKNIDLCRCLSLLLVVCTQSVEEFKTPVAGEYKLECWGAQGRGSSGHPGSGGYAVGSINLSRLYSIYVCVGGYSNCYNNQIGTIRSYYLGSIGGGGTSITTTNDGELKNFKDKQNEVLLVAGGGGASEWMHMEALVVARMAEMQLHRLFIIIPMESKPPSLRVTEQVEHKILVEQLSLEIMK